MRKLDQQRIEQRIRDLEEEPYSPSDEQIEEIKKRAFDEFERSQQKVNIRVDRKQKQRNVLRRVVTITAFAVCFLVSSVIYSALAPVTVANANNFIRRAAIWVNDKLSLGITFTTPVDNTEQLTYGDELTVSTIEELRKVAKFPIAYIPESEEMRIDSIDISNISPNQQSVTLWYSTKDSESIVVKNEALFDSNTIGINTSLLETIDTPIGVVYTWTDGDYNFLKSL